MINIVSVKKLWLYSGVADMRKSYDGLSGLIINQLKANPLSGEGFIFINRKRTQLKCLYYAAGGYCLWCKRLEQGCYASPASKTVSLISMSETELWALLEGFDIVIKSKRKRYELPDKVQAFIN